MAGIYFDNTMIYIKPDFYDDFRCIASACRHSCCAGWEIDIDEDTADYYAELSGAIGGELRAHISAEPEPHFVMTEDGRCPFLCGDGLCRLILTLGEDALCDICAEHPRFYNFTGGREESGLGLCCEEVVRLLYSSDAPIGFIAEDDGEPDEDSAEENEIYLLRGKILHTLADRAHPLHQRMAAACALCGEEMPPLDMRRWAEFYSGLERMHKSWGAELDSLRSIYTFTVPNLPRYERLAAYFVYRHFESPETLRFAMLSTAIVAALDSVSPPEQHAENLRMYSEEIEYSDENIKIICDALKQ